MSKSSSRILKKELYLSDLQNALLSAIAVIIALMLAFGRVSPMGIGFLVIGTQSVAGINVRGNLARRLSGAGQAGLILVGAAALATLVKGILPVSLLAMLLIAYGFGLIRQRFPHNWPDINIPAAVIFFMGYNHQDAIEAIALPAVGTVIGLGLQLVIGLLLPETPLEQTDLPYKKGFRLNPDLQSYVVQLSLLLIIGWLAFRFSGYTFGYWMPFTSIVVLQAHITQTRKKMLDRIAGTLVGCLIGSLILQLKPDYVLQVPILAICMFCFIYFVKVNYAVAAAFITTFVLILIGSQASEPLNVVFERLGFTCAGGILAYLCSFLFLKRKGNA